MGQMVERGIALELGHSLRVRSFRSPEEVSSSGLSYQVLLVDTDEVVGRNMNVSAKPGAGKIEAFLQVCRYMQAQVREVGVVVDLLSPVKTHKHFYSFSSLWREHLLARPQRALLEHVLFYSSTAPERWSPVDQSTFRDKLDATIDLLAKLAPAEPVVTIAVDESDAERGLRLARERRDQLLAQETWLDAKQVHVQQGRPLDAKGLNNTASRLRKEGELLGVWDGREYRHPAFQFSAGTGLLMEEVKTLLEILPKDKSGWRQSFWLFQKHGELDGRRPADLFRDDPAAVIAAARSDFEKSDAQW